VLSIVEQHNKTQAGIYEALARVKAADSMVNRIRLVDHIRRSLFKSAYPLPAYVQNIGWLCLVLWSLMCCTLAIVYGISFDLRYDVEKNEPFYTEAGFEDECLVQNSLELQITNASTVEYIEEAQYALHRPYFPGATSDSGSFLMNILLSVLLSIFIWQPLMIYVMTWIKLWSFSWNGKLKNGVSNVKELLCRCCGKDKHYKQQVAQRGNAKEIEVQHRSSSILLKKERPLDVIGYFSNDQLFLKSQQVLDDDENEGHGAPKFKLLKTVVPQQMQRGIELADRSTADVDGQSERKDRNSIQVLAQKSVDANEDANDEEMKQLHDMLQEEAKAERPENQTSVQVLAQKSASVYDADDEEMNQLADLLDSMDAVDDVDKQKDDDISS